MKLYYSQGACSIAVRIIIHELGLKAEYEAVNLKTKKTATGKDFLQINPKGAVPALLTENNEVLTENAVIQQYLADTYKAYSLLPKMGDMKRYRILEWLNYISTELHKVAGALFNPSLPQEVKDNVIKPLLKSKLDYVDKHLDNKFIADEDFTLPDSYLFVNLSWLPIFKIAVTDWPNLSAYFKRLKTRESVKQAMEEENLLTAENA